MSEKLSLLNGKSSEGLSMTESSSSHSDWNSFLLNDHEYSQLPFSPVDELIGVPLILHPMGNSHDRHTYKHDKHHPWHPKNDLLVRTGTLGGDALRSSRVQLASYDIHHLDYHRRFYGPELPFDDKSRFKLIVFTAAGYIPEQALVFGRRTSNTYTRKLSSEDRLNLWNDGKIRVDSTDVVSKFLKEYSFNQDFSDIKESAIDEFLNTRNSVKKWELGSVLIANSVYKATLPLRNEFEQAYKSELIPPIRTKRVTKFVMSALNIEHQRGRLINELGKKLLQAA